MMIVVGVVVSMFVGVFVMFFEAFSSLGSPRRIGYYQYCFL